MLQCPTHCPPPPPGLAGASASQVPFQRYRIAAEGGASVFVDPTLFALALRMPLKDCLAESVRWAGSGTFWKATVLWDHNFTTHSHRAGRPQATAHLPSQVQAKASQAPGLACAQQRLFPPAHGRRGVEFVLKTGDDQWLSWQHGHSQVSNFYAELPVPLR